MKQFSNLIPFCIFVCYVGYALSVCNFCKKFLGCSKGKEKLFFLFVFSRSICVEILCKREDIPYFLIFLFVDIFFFILVVGLFQAEIEKKLLVAVVIILTKILIGNFSDSFFSCIRLVYLKIFTIEKDSAIFISIEQGEIIGCMALVMVIAGNKLLVKFLIPVFQNKIRKWYLVLSIPLFFIIVIMNIINFAASNGIMVVSNANGARYWNVFYNQILSHIAICIITALCLCAVGFYVFGMNKIYIEQHKKEQYQAQIQFYKMLEEQYYQMERLRHDMKNHMIALQELAENQDWEKIRQYLYQMRKVGGIEEKDEITGNKVIDALLYQKKKQAKQKNILWECNITISKIHSINEFDLCVIIGNILDNALEACEKIENTEQRFICIHGKMVKKCFFLEVKNNRNKIIVVQEDGIGLQNIKETVQKYNGVVKTEIEEDIFKIFVLLPINNEDAV